ncbi:MAG: hypothetical protein CSB28_01215, partial [Desulfobacterales bacterium]
TVKVLEDIRLQTQRKICGIFHLLLDKNFNLKTLYNPLFLRSKTKTEECSINSQQKFYILLTIPEWRKNEKITKIGN